jgi:hypothetical protein
MIRNKIAALATGAGFAICSMSLPVVAQTTTEQGAAMTDAQTSKQAQKAQKKAERKARHAKKNAELNQLEKNGYNPSGSQLNYPQNLQSAQQKANAQKGAASAPAQ